MENELQENETTKEETKESENPFSEILNRLKVLEEQNTALKAQNEQQRNDFTEMYKKAFAVSDNKQSDDFDTFCENKFDKRGKK